MIKRTVKKGVKKEVLVRHESVVHEFLHLEGTLEEVDGPETSLSDEQLQMPTDFKKLPFVVPKTVEHRDKINRILKFSLRQQKEDEVSGHAAIVVHVVSRCLTAVNVQHRIAYGFRRTYPETEPPRDNMMRFEVAPHAWLVIENRIVDNTYMKVMPEKNYKYLCDNTPDCYEEIKYDDPSVATHADVPNVCIPRNEMKQKIDFCMRWPDKALALNHNNEHFYNYFFSMIRYMYEEYGVNVKGINPNIRFTCWGCGCYPQNGTDLYSDTLALRTMQSLESCSEEASCGKNAMKSVPDLCSNSWRFLQCSRCMVANYCGRECQRQHWKEVHETTCLSRGSVYLK